MPVIKGVLVVDFDKKCISESRRKTNCLVVYGNVLVHRTLLQGWSANMLEFSQGAPTVLFDSKKPKVVLNFGREKISLSLAHVCRIWEQKSGDTIYHKKLYNGRDEVNFIIECKKGSRICSTHLGIAINRNPGATLPRGMIESFNPFLLKLKSGCEVCLTGNNRVNVFFGSQCVLFSLDDVAQIFERKGKRGFIYQAKI